MQMYPRMQHAHTKVHTYDKEIISFSYYIYCITIYIYIYIYYYYHRMQDKRLIGRYLGAPLSSIFASI